jgi:uncharacterized protein
MYERAVCQTLLNRLGEARRFMQVLSGPRQTGKTTLVRQVIEKLPIPSHYASADEPAMKDQGWIEQQWETARRFVAGKSAHQAAVLVLDEIQKIPGWSETAKRLWDQDSAGRVPLHVVVLGSAPLLVQRGLAESMAGRFEVIPVTHWPWKEMRKAFGWTLDLYVHYGGYPGAAALIEDPQRWRHYVLESLIEPTLSKDILLMQRVDKPVLLRRLFELGCHYSGRVLSFTKMLGQLQDKGNTVTLAHYLDLLNGCGLIQGLQKYAGQKVRQRGSSPKFQVYNNALITSQGNLSLREAQQDREYWGRLVESAVGAHLLNSARGSAAGVHYWLGRNREVDFVLARGGKIVAIEVKSNRRKSSLPGIEALAKEFQVHKKLLVGGQGIPLEEFLSADVDAWF